MARYRKISTCIHGDAKVCQLSRPKRANGRDLWFYLLTGPHCTSLPGLFRAGIAQLAEENGWTLRATAIVLDEILSLGLAKFDRKAHVLWLPNAIKHNAPESPNAVRSWRQHFDELPATPLKVEALVRFRAFLEEYEQANPPKRPDQSRLAALREAFPEAFQDGFGKAYPVRARACTCAQQEQEQEQEEIKNGAAGAARPSGAVENPDRPDDEPDPADSETPDPDEGALGPMPALPASLDEGFQQTIAAAAAPPTPNTRQIAAVIREDQLPVEPSDEVTEADLADAVKTRCARHGIPYDSRTVDKAVASERFKRRAGARRGS